MLKIKQKIKIIAMIPARKGSERLKSKNLALLNNKPLISYVIEAAKKTKIFHNIIINSDDKIYQAISKRYKVDFYKRPKQFASSNAKSDEVVYDFINKFPCDIIIWVNPIAPLQNSLEIKKIVNYFIKNNLNTLITVNNRYFHSIYKNKPINFKLNEKFSKTQDLMPIQEMVYSVMMWTTRSFLKNYKLKKGPILHGKIGYYPVSKESQIIIKYKEDLLMAEALLNSKNKKIKYDKILNKI